jgi:hypothetical protein
MVRCSADGPEMGMVCGIQWLDRLDSVVNQQEPRIACDSLVAVHFVFTFVNLCL